MKMKRFYKKIRLIQSNLIVKLKIRINSKKLQIKNLNKKKLNRKPIKRDPGWTHMEAVKELSSKSNLLKQLFILIAMNRQIKMN